MTVCVLGVVCETVFERVYEMNMGFCFVLFCSVFVFLLINYIINI